MMALEPSPARNFFAGLGTRLPRPRAILVVSAHHDAAHGGGRATVTASPHPPTIHDFGGFPDELFAMRYPAPGDPALAQRVVDLLAQHGLSVIADPERGLDHGEIGRASGRERVGQYVSISVVAVSLKKKNKNDKTK